MKIDNRHWLITCILLIGLNTVVSLCLYYFGIAYAPIGEWVSIVLVAIACFLFWSHYDYILHLVRYKQDKAACDCIRKEDCPYPNQSQCPYDKSHCCAFPEKPRKEWKIKVLYVILFVAVGLLLACTVLDWISSESRWNSPLTSLAISAIVAVVMAILIDMPGKMKEYQTYFVGLLSSNEYLKELSLEQLSGLRRRITWLQHVRDLPNMPKGMIKLDDRICQMLKDPYFKEYTQIIAVKEKGTGQLLKHNRVEFLAFNPYSASQFVSMDIGMAFSLVFKEENDDYSNDAKLVAQAKQLVNIQRFEITVDKEETVYDLRPHLSLAVKREKKDGLKYNGRVILVPKDPKYTKQNALKNSDLGTSNSTPSGQVVNMECRCIGDNDNQDLFFEFRDRISVKIEYEVTVPITDVTYTKRLRYPVKYFNLDYSLEKDTLSGYTVIGQIIGTLLDQEDVSDNLSDEDRRVFLRTHSWLLPKNGAVIVMKKG